MNDTPVLQTAPAGPVQGRECGSCTLCCKVLHFADIDKPAGKWCQHVAQGRGCSIHATKPDVCRVYHCEWMLNPSLGPEWKPDRARFVMGTYPGTTALAVWLDPGAQGAWLKEPYYSMIKHWARIALINNTYVMVLNGNRVTVVLPTGNADLGPLETGDNIVVYNQGGTYSAAVERAAG